MGKLSIHQLIADVFFATILPGFVITLWLTDLILLRTLKISLFIWLILFLILPIIFKYSTTLQRGILFLTFISYPPPADLETPDKLGLYGTRNFYIEYADPNEQNANVRLGVWHVLPDQTAKRFAAKLKIAPDVLDQFPDDKNSSYGNDLDEIKFENIEKVVSRSETDNEENNKHALFEEILRQTSAPIVFYLHGNTASRGAPHRIELYKVMRKIGFHVISMDYRGYGDSGNIQPTEEGVVSDALKVYDYIRNITKNPVLLWGHSLGTGVSTHLLSIMAKMDIPGPKALILESAFTNIRDELRAHPLSKLYRNLPWFDYLISEPMYYSSLRFVSDEHISEFTQPILMLHAEDDLVVPYKLGLQLYRVALDTRGKQFGPVKFHTFSASCKYGHKYICRDPKLPALIYDFFETNKDFDNKQN